MLTIEKIIQFARWSGYFTLFCAALAILGWVLKWGIRFRLVGVTGFMVVLTGGLFALGLGLHENPEIPGAVRYSRVLDTGGSQVVINVPATITETELEATLRQAAADLFSPGRLSQGAENLTIRARALVHIKPGLSQPVYLGQVQQSLRPGEGNNLQVEVNHDKFALLPKPTA
jgi:hypothetical protein